MAGGGGDGDGRGGEGVDVVGVVGGGVGRRRRGVGVGGVGGLAARGINARLKPRSIANPTARSDEEQPGSDERRCGSCRMECS